MIKLSDAEWTVMQALWEKSPASVREVLERTRATTDWAYTTVKTLLERLVDKGAARARKRANLIWFEALVSRKAARRSALRSLLDRAFDGRFGALIQHLVADEKLPRKERERLLALLDEAVGEGT